MSLVMTNTASEHQHLFEEETRVQNNLFIWTIKDFATQFRNGNFGLLARLILPDRGNYPSLAIFKLELNLQIDDMRISLSRLKSENNSAVSVRFCSVIKKRGNRKCIPTCIHYNLGVDKTISISLLNTDTLEEIEMCISPDGHLSVFCELQVMKDTSILSTVNEYIPFIFKAVSCDRSKMIISLPRADAIDCTDSDVSIMYKAIHSVKLCVFTEWIEETVNEMCFLRIGSYKRGLRALLQFMYSEILRFYPNCISPTSCTEAEMLKATKGKDINYECPNGIVLLRHIDVTWRIPQFRYLLCNPHVSIYWPGRESATRFDDVWNVQLEFDSSGTHVGIFVHRARGERSVDFVRFAAKVITRGEVSFSRYTVLRFTSDGAQGIAKFINKDLLLTLLTEHSLVLECCLQILNLESMNREYHDVLTTSLSQIYSFNPIDIESLRRLPGVIKEMLVTGRLRDAVTHAISEDSRLYPCVLTIRLLALVPDIRSFPSFLDLTLIKMFFSYINSSDNNIRFHGGLVNAYRSASIEMRARMDVFNVFLAFLYRGDDGGMEFIDGDIFMRNVPKRQSSPFCINESDSSDESEDSGSPGVSDHNSSFEADLEVQAITENPVAISTLQTYGQYRSLVITEDNYYSISGSHYILRPRFTSGSHVNLDRSTETDSSDGDVFTFNVGEINPIDAQFEQISVVCDTLNRYRSPLEFESRSTYLNTNSTAFIPVVQFRYLNRNHSANDGQSSSMVNQAMLYAIPNVIGLPRSFHNISAGFEYYFSDGSEMDNGNNMVNANQVIMQPLNENAWYGASVPFLVPYPLSYCVHPTFQAYYDGSHISYVHNGNVLFIDSYYPIPNVYFGGYSTVNPIMLYPTLLDQRFLHVPLLTAQVYSYPIHNYVESSAGYPIIIPHSILYPSQDHIGYNPSALLYQQANDYHMPPMLHTYYNNMASNRLPYTIMFPENLSRIPLTIAGPSTYSFENFEFGNRDRWTLMNSWRRRNRWTPMYRRNVSRTSENSFQNDLNNNMRHRVSRNRAVSNLSANAEGFSGPRTTPSWSSRPSIQAEDSSINFEQPTPEDSSESDSDSTANNDRNFN